MQRLSLALLVLPLVWGCVGNGRTNLDLYNEAQNVRLYGFACDGAPPAELEERWLRLRPWLASRLSQETISRFEMNVASERELLDLIRCPTAQEKRRSTAAYARLIIMLESRARRSSVW